MLERREEFWVQQKMVHPPVQEDESQTNGHCSRWGSEESMLRMPKDPHCKSNIHTPRNRFQPHDC